MDRSKIPGIVGISLLVFLCIVLGYGIWHDFSAEYEAAHPIQYDMIVYDSNGNEMRVEDTQHGKKSKNYRIEGNRLVTLTPLDEEGMRIQRDTGCVACH